MQHAGKPTLPTLIKSCLSSHCTNIPSRIGQKYWQFGILLLDDDDGHVIDAIVHEHQRDAEVINLKILQLWINGVGQQPVTWGTLIQVLHDIQLNELAREINKYYQQT